jgi:hypothetical protein
MKTYWGSEGVTPRILNLGATWRWVVSFMSWLLYIQVLAPGTHWMGGWEGPRAVLDAVWKGEMKLNSVADTRSFGVLLLTHLLYDDQVRTQTVVRSNGVQNVLSFLFLSCKRERDDSHKNFRPVLLCVMKSQRMSWAISPLKECIKYVLVP